MLFQKGTTRFVLVFTKLGFVIKLPIIKFGNIWSGVKYTKKYGWKASSEIWKIEVTSQHSPFYSMIMGIIANRLEWYFWRKTKHPLLQPTWFSAFGLINIQKYGKPLQYREIGWLGMNMQVVTNQTSHAHVRGHTLGEANNYTSVNGQLRLLDYGSKNVWPVILNYGEKIANLTITECQHPPKK